VLIAWLVGAESVRVEVWPAGMAVGLNTSVIPLGTPLTANVASPLKPFPLLRVTAKVTC
jgi:hypothetical protein